MLTSIILPDGPVKLTASFADKIGIERSATGK
jgi:hypothetical protein